MVGNTMAEQDFWLLDLSTMRSRRLTRLSSSAVMRTFDFTRERRADCIRPPDREFGHTAHWSRDESSPSVVGWIRHAGSQHLRRPEIRSRGPKSPSDSSLASSRRKVFLSADALGLLVDLLCSRRTPALARPRAHEEAPGHDASQLDGAAGALCLDHRLPVARRCGRGVARLGAWV